MRRIDEMGVERKRNPDRIDLKCLQNIPACLSLPYFDVSSCRCRGVVGLKTTFATGETALQREQKLRLGHHCQGAGRLVRGQLDSKDDR